MAYLETYRAYARMHDGENLEWTGLRKGQAKWRYYWIARQYLNNPLAWNRMRDYGWEREWKA